MRNFLRDPRDQNSAAKTGEELSVCVNQSRSMKFCLAVLAAAKPLPINDINLQADQLGGHLWKSVESAFQRLAHLQGTI